MTAKQKARLRELLKKVTEEKKSLDEKEMKEFKTLLKLLYEEKEKKEKPSESVDLALDIALAEKALELSEKRKREEEFSKLPLQKKHEKLKREIKELREFYSKATQTVKEKEEKETFEEFYQKHVEKYGKSI